MPIGPLSADQTAAAMAAASSDLLSLFAAEGVDATIQAKFYHIGVTTIARLSIFAKDFADMTNTLKDEFEVDSSASIADRVRVGSVLVAWQRASNRQEKSAELEGELTSKRLARPLNSSEYFGMRDAFQRKWWPLDDRSLPARSYLESRADDLENLDYRAETLSRVISREEDGDPSMLTFFDTTGRMQLKRGSVEAPAPTNQEQLRYRIKLWTTALIMLSLRNSNRAMIQNLCPQDAEDYLTYLLGDFCFGMTGLNSEGHTIAAPSWPQLLIYEFQVRKRMYHLMFSENVQAPEALKSAYRDPVVKERYFTTPVALASVARRPFNAFNADGSKELVSKRSGASIRQLSPAKK